MKRGIGIDQSLRSLKKKMSKEALERQMLLYAESFIPKEDIPQDTSAQSANLLDEMSTLIGNIDLNYRKSTEEQSGDVDRIRNIINTLKENIQEMGYATSDYLRSNMNSQSNLPHIKKIRERTIEIELRRLVRTFGEESVVTAFHHVTDEVNTKRKPDKFESSFPELTGAQVEAIGRQAKAHPWSERGNDDRTPFEWVRDNYGEWIPGLLQSHLQVDMPLYHAFAQAVRRKGLPEWLDVPSGAESRLRSIASPEDRDKTKAIRDWQAAKKRTLRAKKRLTPG